LRDTGDTCLVTSLRNGKCFSRNISDLAPALIALDAEITIRNQKTQFTIPLSKLYVQDGIRFIGQLDDDGILTSVRLSKSTIAYGFRKLRLRRALDFTSLTVAACMDAQRIVRIGLNGISMAPILIAGKHTDLSLDEIRKQCRLRSKIVDNDLLPLKYRQDMLDLYLEELWQILSHA
jgi:CO/xanthine dehydrogenase FAD-binding subunit